MKSQDNFIYQRRQEPLYPRNKRNIISIVYKVGFCYLLVRNFKTVSF